MRAEVKETEAEKEETEAEEEFVGLEARDFDAGCGLQEVETVREHQIEQETAKAMVELVGQSSKVLEGGALWNFCEWEQLLCRVYGVLEQAGMDQVLEVECEVAEDQDWGAEVHLVRLLDAEEFRVDLGAAVVHFAQDVAQGLEHCRLPPPQNVAQLAHQFQEG